MLQNEFICIDIQKAGNRLASVTIQDKINGRTYDLGTDIFSLQIREEEINETCSFKIFKDSCYKLAANELRCGDLVTSEIEAKPTATCLAERRAGQRVTASFSTATDGNIISWWAELREGAPYLRVGLDIFPGQFSMPARRISLLNIAADQARVEGSVQGAPVVAAGNRLFAGLEHPCSTNSADANGFDCAIELKTDLPRRATSSFSAVLGFCNPTQLRRCFQIDYLNEVRARPYAPFLNYNTWYDIGYFTRYDEKQALETVKLFGEELVEKRGAVLDSFMMDDGWDKVETLWQFHEGLPEEFRNVDALTRKFNSSIGMWLSAWGGYGEPKELRLKAADGAYETNERGFALSGPKYYECFRDICLRMIRDNGCKHFKFDGTSNQAQPAAGSQFGSDFEAIIALIAELRTEQPELYVNLTTGTWASPFWFGIADSIWRGAWDHDFCGEGSKRQQWITYRDTIIFENNAKISPLFPINSLMTHGVIYNKSAHDLTTTEGNDLADEIWSGFGLGSQMQELYITPSMMKPEEWDSLAAAAKWARSHGDVMVDTHWVGGNPVELGIYGWASWNMDKAVLTLRNPSSKEQTYSFDAAAVFELPLGAPTKYAISSPKGDKLPVASIEAGKPCTITLKPFEVLVIDAAPLNN